MLIQWRLERKETNLMHFKRQVTWTHGTSLIHLNWGSLWIVTSIFFLLVLRRNFSWDEVTFNFHHFLILFLAKRISWKEGARYYSSSPSSSLKTKLGKQHKPEINPDLSMRKTFIGYCTYKDTGACGDAFDEVTCRYSCVKNAWGTAGAAGGSHAGVWVEYTECTAPNSVPAQRGCINKWATISVGQSPKTWNRIFSFVYCTRGFLKYSLVIPLIKI